MGMINGSEFRQNDSEYNGKDIFDINNYKFTTRVKYRFRRLIETIFNIYPNYKKRKQEKSFDKQLNDAVTTFVNSLDNEYYKPIFTQILNNQITYIKNSLPVDKNIDSTFKKEFMLPIVFKILKQLIPLFKIIGIQPMQGPVGLIYTLNFSKEKSSDTLTLNVISEAVEASVRKLYAGWTIEAQQDINSFYALDLVAEITKALTDEIAIELTTEILNDLNVLATDESFKESGIVNNIIQAAEIIKTRTNRGRGNWTIVSEDVFDVIKNDPLFTHEVINKSTTLLYAGILDKIQVYILPKINNINVSNYVLVGYKGQMGETDTGYIFCPYTLLLDRGLCINPATFQPYVALLTRNGKAFNIDKENSSNYYIQIK